MTEPLLATVGSIGRFHTFDLAYELQKRGHLAAVYSGYPKRNFRNTRVDPRLMRCFPWIQTPLELASRCGVIPQRLYQPLSLMAHKSLARYIARTLPPCHVLSMLSGTGLEGGRAAQARNIAYVCRRGSAHIAWQDRILREEHELLGLHYEPIHPRFIEREQEEYQLADAITVPSSFSLRSFLDMGIDRRKLYLTPYGVDLRSYRRICPREDVFRVLFVGALSIRKGLHCLLRGFARARLPNARLILVGAAQTETAIF